MFSDKVLTRAEAEIRYQRTGEIVTWSNVKTGQFFFTEQHCLSDQAIRLLPDGPANWVPCSHHARGGKLTCTPQPRCPSGIMKTVEDYIAVFYFDGTEIVPQFSQMIQHKCETPYEARQAIELCEEHEDGSMWVVKDERRTRVNFCPFCGKRARVPLLIHEGTKSFRSIE